jgi:hypothetical protein
VAIVCALVNILIPVEGERQLKQTNKNPLNYFGINEMFLHFSFVLELKSNGRSHACILPDYTIDQSPFAAY